MGISLRKGQGVSLRKQDSDLSRVTIGLGWEINREPGAEDYDLDIVAFLCGPDGRVHDLGRDPNGKATLERSDVIFYNNPRHRSDCIWLTGDHQTGSGHGDDEQIVVKLDALPLRYAKVVFVVQIYQGSRKGQSFGRVRKAFIRAADARGRELARFDLSGGAQYEDCRSMCFAALEREAGGWKFDAIGTPSPSDSFVEFLKQYV